MGALILRKLKGFKIGEYSLFSARWSSDPNIPQPKGKVFTGAQLMEPREVPWGYFPVGTDTRTPGYTGKRQGGAVRRMRPRRGRR